MSEASTHGARSTSPMPLASEMVVGPRQSSLAAQVIEGRREVEQLRAAIAEHKAAIETAGKIRVFDSKSATIAGAKNHADRALWSVLEGGPSGG